MVATDVHPHVALRAPRPAVGADRRPPPRVAEGIELIGEYEDSGFKVNPWIARRADGQMIQLTEVLYAIAAAADGRRDLNAIAAHVREASGRAVNADNVGTLIEDRLRPIGVLAEADGSSPEIAKADQLLALKLKTSVIPERVVETICTVFKPLFLPPVVLVVLAGLVVFDIWVFFVHGIGAGLREALYNPATMFLLLGLVVVGTAFHECGHAAGCAYGGARPGVMGAGLYFVWPAFYTDVTDSYRLSKRGRLRTDLGGVYFNFIFILVLAGIYGLTGFEPLLLVVMVQHFAVLQQLLPFLRLDGYYVLSDLTGVPDLFTRMKPILNDLVPGRDGGDKVRALKPWVRVVTTLWIGVLIPVVVFNIVFLVTQVPRIYATSWDSLLIQWDALRDAFGESDLVGILAGGVQTAALVLPVAGVTYTFIRLGRRIATGTWQWTGGRPVLRGALAASLVVFAGAAAWSWWPNGEYKPIQEGERLNVATISRSAQHLPTGRPALTEEREAQLNGAPSERERLAGEQEDGPTDDPEAPAPSSTTTSTTTSSTTEEEEVTTTSTTSGGTTTTTGTSSTSTSTSTSTSSTTSTTNP